MSGFATEERHPQKLEVLGFFPLLIGMSPCISPEFKETRFLLSQLQMERLHAMAETF